MLTVTVLGCGSSLGVPVIGCDCKVCASPSPYNKRTRSAIFIEQDDTKILVDFGFEIREQLVKACVKNLDAAILTHDHADHVSGIDNLRAFPFLQNQPLDIYIESASKEIVENKYKYLFKDSLLCAVPIDFYAKVQIKNVEVQFFRQTHAEIDSLGIRISDFVYSSDVVDFPPKSQEYLDNIDTWIVDCVAYKTMSAHAGLDRILLWNEKYKPRQILLTNMRHDIDYEEIIKILPKNIAPLYDGYQFKI